MTLHRLPCIVRAFKVTFLKAFAVRVSCDEKFLQYSWPDQCLLIDVKLIEIYVTPVVLEHCLYLRTTVAVIVGLIVLVSVDLR